MLHVKDSSSQKMVFLTLKDIQILIGQVIKLLEFSFVKSDSQLSAALTKAVSAKMFQGSMFQLEGKRKHELYRIFLL